MIFSFFGDARDINASVAPVMINVWDICTIELLLCLLNLLNNPSPFTLLSQTPCSVLSPFFPPQPCTAHDALSVSQPVPCACAAAASAAAAAATLQKLGKD